MGQLSSSPSANKQKITKMLKLNEFSSKTLKDEKTEIPWSDFDSNDIYRQKNVFFTGNHVRR